VLRRGLQARLPAKGLCFFHYKKWRRSEIEGRPRRYKTCSKPDCEKKVAAHGLCQEHFDAWKKARLKAKLSARPRPPPPRRARRRGARLVGRAQAHVGPGRAGLVPAHARRTW